MERSQTETIKRDLQKKMVFLVGPRQVGKTWLAKEIGRTYVSPTYLNYDHAEDWTIIKNEDWVPETDLLILDEIHKMPEWKNYLKGVYDTKPDRLHILVTGSARLETFRQGGDALSGRFFVHHLLPFSVAEIAERNIKHPVLQLLERGGFPEPFLAKNNKDANRWRKRYADGLIRSDILDFERVHDLRAMQTIFERLRLSVGSPVSFSSLARDSAISPATAQRYVQILEALFIVFRVTPFSRSISRSLLKEPKIYFFDSVMVKGDGAIFENFVAVSLLKYCYLREDENGENVRLQYLRTKEGHEADFCLVKDDSIERVIEAKVRKKSIASGLQYFCAKYDLPGIQLVQNLRLEKQSDMIEVRNAETWLRKLIP